MLASRESRSIMIVGNGPVAPGAAATIDAADLVVRFNHCNSYGAGGRKTDVIAVCNTGRPALSMLGGGSWKNSAAVRDAAQIWCTRSPERFAAMRGPLSFSNPDLADFCDDYSDGFRAFAAATGKALVMLSAATHAAVDEELAADGAEPHVVPSSGLLVIAHVLEAVALAGDRVMLAGFGHTGWEWHPFSAERRFVERLVSDGRVSRVDQPVPSAFSQGA